MCCGNNGWGGGTGCGCLWIILIIIILCCCCGGSWMVKGDMMKAGEFDKIKDMTAEAVSLVKKIRG